MSSMARSRCLVPSRHQPGRCVPIPWSARKPWADRWSASLIGWSFGAVVITAGALSDRVVGVATIASQSYGTELALRSLSRSASAWHGHQTLPTLARGITSVPIQELEITPWQIGLDEVRDRMNRLIEWLLHLQTGEHT